MNTRAQSAASSKHGRFACRLVASQTVWAVALLLVILAVVTAIRIGLLDLPLERDEGEYAYVGQLMLQGVPPYREVYTMKWPGTPAVYALFMALFGQTAGGIHARLILVSLGTTVVVFFLTRRLCGAVAGMVASGLRHRLCPRHAPFQSTEAAALTQLGDDRPEAAGAVPSQSGDHERPIPEHPEVAGLVDANRRRRRLVLRVTGENLDAGFLPAQQNMSQVALRSAAYHLPQGHRANSAGDQDDRADPVGEKKIRGREILREDGPPIVKPAGTHETATARPVGIQQEHRWRRHRNAQLGQFPGGLVHGANDAVHINNRRRACGAVVDRHRPKSAERQSHAQPDRIVSGQVQDDRRTRLRAG
jgi:hypothetical protein